MKSNINALAKPKRTAVKLEKITTDPAVFQPRQDGLNHGHVANLKATLKRGDALDPIRVRRQEDGTFVVLDGHHSLEAYQQARWGRGVPVLVYTCTEAEGQLVAIRENSKHRLQMTDEDKSDWAWRITCEQEGLSKAEVSRICNRSPATVGRMRQTREKLKAAGIELPDTWAKAQRSCRDVDMGEFDEGRQEEWRLHTIAKIKEQISGAISPFAQWNPEVVLEAVWEILGEDRFRTGLGWHGFREVEVCEITNTVTLLDDNLDDGDDETEVPF